MVRKGLQYYLNALNPLMVTYARELRGLTKKDLAIKIGKTPATLTRIENGSLVPEIDTFFSLACALDIEPAFFARLAGEYPAFDVSRIHFRGKRGVSASKKRLLIRSGEAIYDAMRYFENQGVVFPNDALSEFSTTASSLYEIEELAVAVRKNMELGFGPLPDLIHALEAAGVFVLFLPKREQIAVDAFSSVIERRNVILVCSDQPPSRILFSIAHEVGHLLLHEFTDGSMQQENEANRFASAFLLPWKSFSEECPRRWNLSAFIEMKKRWSVSISAMLYRAKELGCVSEASYTRAVRSIRDQGIYYNEPAEPIIEEPRLFSEAFKMVARHGLTMENITEELGRKAKSFFHIAKAQGVAEEQLEMIRPKQKLKKHKLLSFQPQSLLDL